jgi:hypothetical protein
MLRNMPHIFPLLDSNHWLITERTQCPICAQPFAVGDRLTMIPIGPDPNDDEAVRKYLTGDGDYNARARCIHEACLTEVLPIFLV